MQKIEDESSDSFKLTKGLYLCVKGAILWRNIDNEKALVSLKWALTFSELLLKEHTDIARCYNAIGNCLIALNQHREVLEFFKKAYNMQEKLAFECKKAAKRNSHSKMKKKVEILKLIIMLCNFYPLEEIEVF